MLAVRTGEFVLDLSCFLGAFFSCFLFALLLTRRTFFDFSPLFLCGSSYSLYMPHVGHGLTCPHGRDCGPVATGDKKPVICASVRTIASHTPVTYERKPVFRAVILKACYMGYYRSSLLFCTGKYIKCSLNKIIKSHRSHRVDKRYSVQVIRSNIRDNNVVLRVL